MKELYEKVAGDSGLQEKFAGIMKDAEKAGEEAVKEKLTAFAKEAGYEVSFEEMQEFFRALSEKKEGELSDAELDSVAGGKSPTGVDNIGHSIFTLGTTCAFGSLYHLIGYGPEACGKLFE